MPQTRILYVEDNDDLRESITMLLEDDPAFALTTCASGEEALELYQQGGEWDVLITDVGLPGMSGVELAREAQTRSPRQWVVLCSGYDMRSELATLGPNARSLTKPFELDDLERLLAEIAAALRTSPP